MRGWIYLLRLIMGPLRPIVTCMHRHVLRPLLLKHLRMVRIGNAPVDFPFLTDINGLFCLFLDLFLGAFGLEGLQGVDRSLGKLIAGSPRHQRLPVISFVEMLRLKVALALYGV